jgi:hypothetical protein
VYIARRGLSRRIQPVNRRGNQDHLPWQLAVLVDDKEEDTGFALLRGPISSHNRPAFDALAANHRMIGLIKIITSPSPGSELNFFWREGWDPAHVAVCEAWCHCFRDPDPFLPADRPRFLISNSDFVDSARVCELAYEAGPVAKRWDVVYCTKQDWSRDVMKDWTLAKACIDVLVHDLNLSVLVIGRDGLPDVPRHPNVDIWAEVSWAECLGCIARSRLVLVSGRLDPSPRVITEALALDVPVLVNAEILGGWKYVNEATGSLFDGESDVGAKAGECLSGAYRPRAWLLEHYGRDNSARRLAECLRTLGGADDLTYARPA